MLFPMFHTKQKSRITRSLKKATHILVGFTMLLWTLGPIAPELLIPKVHAATASVTLSRSQLVSGNFSGVPFTNGILLGFSGALDAATATCDIDDAGPLASFPCYGGVNNSGNAPAGTGITVAQSTGTTRVVYLIIPGETAASVFGVGGATNQNALLLIAGAGPGQFGSAANNDTIAFADPNFASSHANVKGLSGFLSVCGGGGAEPACTGSVPFTLGSNDGGGGPTNGATGIPDFPGIDINFSTEVDANTVTHGTTVKLEMCGGSTDAITCSAPITTVTLNSNKQVTGAQVRVSSDAPLQLNTTYRVTYLSGANGIKSSTGSTLSSDVVRIWRTVASGSGVTTTQSSSAAGTPDVMTDNLHPSGGFPTNGVIVLTFNNQMTEADVEDPAKMMLKAESMGQPSGSNLCATNCTYSLAADAVTLTITPGSGVISANTNYVFVIGSNVRNYDSQTNLSGSATGREILLYFYSGGGADSTTFSVNATSPFSAATGIQVNLPDVMIQFSKDISSASANISSIILCQDANTNSTCDGGETSPTYDVTYDSMSRTVHLGLKSILSPNAQYCILVYGASAQAKVTDASGTGLSSNSINCFTTSSTAYTAIAPTIQYCQGDNHGVSCAFDQSIEAADAVKSNFSLSCNNQNINISSTTTTLSYRAEYRSVELDGLGLTTNDTCTFTATNISELSGVVTASSLTSSFKVADFNTTGGYMGTDSMPSFDDKNMAEYWEKPERCQPMNAIAGQATSFDVEFPTPAALTTGASVIITFPSGVDVSGAYIDSTSYWQNQDMNGPGPGITTFKTGVTGDSDPDTVPSTRGGRANDGVMVNTSARSVTVYFAHSGDVMLANDSLFFTLSGLTTSSSTGEQSCSMVVKDTTGVAQGTTIYPAPWSSQQGGSLSLGGRIYKDDNNNQTYDSGTDTGLANIKVFCDSFGGFGTGGIMAGHMEDTTDANGQWSMSGLTDGKYGCGMPPLDMGSTTYQNLAVESGWKEVVLSGSSISNLDFRLGNLANDTTSQVLSISVVGGATLADAGDDDKDDLDVFCHAGSSNFQFSAPVMAALDFDASGNASGSLRLKGGNTYECGIGPHMAFDTFSAGGPPPMPNFTFMPPRPEQVVVPTNTAPSPLTFNLVVAGNTITGTVTDGTNAIANAFVHAEPQVLFDSTTGERKEGFGAFTQSKSNGGFTLNVSPGTYLVGADAPGRPESERQEVTVTTSGTLLQKGSTVTSITLKLVSSSTTVAGAVQDENGNGLKYAQVSAEKIQTGGTCSSFSPAGGFRDTPSDGSGNYTLYLSAGTWNIRAYSPSYGEVACKTVTMASTSLTGQDLKATSGDYKTISGTAPDGSFVSAFSTSGANHTQSNGGTYSIKVKSGTNYTVECFSPGKGPCGRSTGVNATSNVTADFGTSVTTGTVSVTVTGITDAFIDLRDSNGQGNGTGKNSSGVYTLTIKPGTYTLRGGSPKYGELCSGQTVTVTASQTVAATCTPPSTLRTVAARITDGTNNLSGAAVTFVTTDGKSIKTNTDAKSGSNNNLSVTNVPDGSYTLKASKKGYEPASTTATVSGGNLTITSAIALTPTSGSNGETITMNVQSGSSTYTSDATIVATKDGKTVTAEMDKVTGQVSVDLTNGTWTVVAYGDNCKKSSSSTVTVANGSISGTAPTLSLDTSMSGCSSKSESPTISSAKSGGIIKSSSFSGLEVNIPASTLSTSDSTTAKFDIKSDPTIMGSDPGTEQNIVGSYGFDFTPKDASGNPIKTLSGDSITLTIPYTDADVASAGVDESKLVFASLTDGVWESFSTTVDTTNNKLTVEVSHFSTFGVLGAASSSTGYAGSDTVVPAMPKNFKISQSGSSAVLAWDAVSDSDLKEYQILRGVDPVPPSASVYATIQKGTQTYTDSAVEIGKKYRYQIVAVDTSGNKSTVSSEISITMTTPTAAPATTSGSGTTTTTTTSSTTATTTTTPATSTTTTTVTTSTSTTDARAAQIDRIKIEAAKVIKGAAEIAASMSMSRDATKESSAKALIAKFSTTTASDSTAQAFVAYGTAESKGLGSGERAGVLSSYMTAYGKAPYTEADWQDVLKIGAGRFPGVASGTAETNAKASFKKIYKRDANMANANDSAAVNVMAYGLRPSTRNLSSEAAAIKTFKSVYGKNPSSAMDWDATRAISYSGAKR